MTSVRNDHRFAKPAPEPVANPLARPPVRLRYAIPGTLLMGFAGLLLCPAIGDLIRGEKPALMCGLISFFAAVFWCGVLLYRRR